MVFWVYIGVVLKQWSLFGSHTYYVPYSNRTQIGTIILTTTHVVSGAHISGPCTTERKVLSARSLFCLSGCSTENGTFLGPDSESRQTRDTVLHVRIIVARLYVAPFLWLVWSLRFARILFGFRRAPRPYRSGMGAVWENYL